MIATNHKEAETAAAELPDPATERGRKLADLYGSVSTDSWWTVVDRAYPPEVGVTAVRLALQKNPTLMNGPRFLAWLQKTAERLGFYEP